MNDDAFARRWQSEIESHRLGEVYDDTPPPRAPNGWRKLLARALSRRGMAPCELFGTTYLLPNDPGLEGFRREIAEGGDPAAVAILRDWLAERGCPVPLPVHEAALRYMSDPVGSEARGHEPRSHGLPVRLELHQLRLDPDIQPRTQLNVTRYEEYAEGLRADPPVRLPPVDVFLDEADVYWLADGWHRREAHVLAGRSHIWARIHRGARRDAILFAVGANATHGLHRSNADKRRAVSRLLADNEWRQWSNREIARRCRVDESLVRDMRQELSAVLPQIHEATSPPQPRTVRRGGTTYTMDTARIGRTQETPQQEARKQERREEVAKRLSPRERIRLAEEGLRNGDITPAQCSIIAVRAAEEIILSGVRSEPQPPPPRRQEPIAPPQPLLPCVPQQPAEKPAEQTTQQPPVVGIGPAAMQGALSQLQRMSREQRAEMRREIDRLDATEKSKAG